jgi:hypothetical protein
MLGLFYCIHVIDRIETSYLVFCLMFVAPVVKEILEFESLVFRPIFYYGKVRWPKVC